MDAAMFAKIAEIGMSATTVVAISFLFAGNGVRAQEKPAHANEIQRLADQLADPTFARREAAATRLDSIGEPALDILHKRTETADLEAARRATLIIRKIHRRVFGAQARWAG